MIIITGGIGAGKSVVSRILRSVAVPVFDCDYEAKEIMSNSATIRNFIKEEFGACHIGERGEIDRGKLRTSIYGDSSKRQKLNTIVHSEVRRKMENFISANGIDCFVESAIPYTGKLLEYAHEVWIVDAPVDLRLRRVRERNGLSDREILDIMEVQQTEIDSVKAFGLPIKTIDNDGRESVMKEIFAFLLKKD